MKLLLFCLIVLCWYVSCEFLPVNGNARVFLSNQAFENATPLVAHIFEYFDEAAEGRWFIISEIRGFYEMTYDDRVSKTLRVHFGNDSVRMVWLAWRINADGRDVEVETDVSRRLDYGAYGTSRVDELAAFERTMDLCNKVALEAFKKNNLALVQMLDDIREFVNK